MTLQEANEQVEICERQITSAYSNLKSAARDVGSAGYSAAWDEEVRKKNEEDKKYRSGKTKTVLFFIILPLLLIFYELQEDLPLGLLLFLAWIFFLLFIGPVLFDSGMPDKNKKNNILENINRQQSALNSTLDNHKI